MTTRRDTLLDRQMNKAALRQGKPVTLSTADGGYLRVHVQGGRWVVTESPKGGLKGGTMVHGSRRQAMEYARRRQQVIERKHGK